nr:PAAR domain-containing protein [Vibrio rotiferianus]
MPSAARLGDSGGGHGCFPATPIIAGSGDVSINGKPAARKGDAVLLHACPCPYKPHGVHGRSISAGSSNVSINGKPAARVGDAIDCGGSVASGSGNVFIGDTPYQSPTHECGEGASREKIPFLRILPMATPKPAFWAKAPFIPEQFAELAKQQVKTQLTEVQPGALPPLAEEIVNSVKNGASKKEMLALLEGETTKAMRRKAREAITEQASAKAPEKAERFSKDMDAAEKAMLSDHIYTLDKPVDELDDRRKQLADDFDNDSGWSLASDEDLDDLGLPKEYLRVGETNFKAEVYMPDTEVFGDDSKPVLVFRGTENGEDWLNNIRQGLNRENDSDYYKQAVTIGIKLEQSGSAIEIAGHSLGGGLTSAASKAGGFKATTFNSAGLHKKTVARYGVAPEHQGSDDNITRYRIDGELLTYFQEDAPLINRAAPSAIGNTTHSLPKPKSLTLTAAGVGGAIAAGLGSRGAMIGALAGGAIGYAGVKGKEKLDLHGMDMMREAIEERKVNDLHSLAKQA